MTSAPLGMAVVGASGHAARVSAPTIANSSGARLAGVLGSTPESGARLAAEYPGAVGYDDWDALAADENVSAVWIAGPNHLHAEFAARCLEAGKHIMVEKPIAAKASDAKRVADLAEDKGLTAVVGFQHRFRPGHSWMKDAIDAGIVGTPHKLRIHRNWPYPYFPDMPEKISGWRTSVEDSGGWALNDIGSHHVDLALWLLGQSGTLAFSRTSNFTFHDVEAEDSSVLVVDGSEGAVLVLETSNAFPSFPGTIEVHGSDGWLRADATFEDYGSVLDHTGKRREFTTTGREVYVGELEDFVHRIESGQGRGTTAREAVTTTEIIEQAASRHRAG